MIALPTARALTSAMLVGAAVGALAGIASTVFLLVTTPAHVAIALSLGVPTVLGLALIMFAGRRWTTAFGAMLITLAPAWFAALVAARVITGA